MRNFSRSSILRRGGILDNWLDNNRCVLCTNTTNTNPWCDACLGSLPAWTREPPRFPGLDNVTIGYRYEYPIDRLIQAAKYRRNFLLATAMATLLPLTDNLSARTVLYPVPVSKWRLQRRGFNQTRVFADSIKRQIGCSIDEVSIHKRSWLKDQSALDARARKCNARKLFIGKFSKAAAQHAVIIDDVITTGATVSTLARLLRAHGAERIDVIALSAVT